MSNPAGRTRQAKRVEKLVILKCAADVHDGESPVLIVRVRAARSQTARPQIVAQLVQLRVTHSHQKPSRCHSCGTTVAPSRHSDTASPRECTKSTAVFWYSGGSQPVVPREERDRATSEWMNEGGSNCYASLVQLQESTWLRRVHM